MNRILPFVGAVAGVVLIAACGSASASSSSASPSPSRGAQFRNGASGQLVQINGQMLILTGAAGDTVVTLSATTTFSRTSVAALADVVSGVCIVATGQKDASGALTATTVRITPKGATGCAAGGFGGQGFGPGASPPPGASPRPTPSGLPNAAFVAGEVTAASGVSITVLTAASGSQVITVPTTASITKSATVTAADLTKGECILATGQKDASGAVQATSVAITPAGPSGTCTTGFGGRGGGRGGAPPSGAPAGG